MGIENGIEGYNLNPEQRERLKKAVNEAVEVRYKIDGYKDVLKEIREVVKEELGVKPRDFNKVVKILKEDKANQFDDEHRVLLDLVETVTNTATFSK